MKERDRETAIETEGKKGGERYRERARARRRGDGGQRARRARQLPESQGRDVLKALWIQSFFLAAPVLYFL